MRVNGVKDIGAHIIAKTYRKLKAWEHEREYRLAIDNSFYNLNDLKNRNLKFHPRYLKGLIWN